MAALFTPSNKLCDVYNAIEDQVRQRFAHSCHDGGRLSLNKVTSVDNDTTVKFIEC